MFILDMIADIDVQDICRGYLNETDHFTCLLCGTKIEKGIIYNYDNILYEAEKYIKIHIKNKHSSVFEYLIKY